MPVDKPLKQGVVPQSQVEKDPYKCPVCGSDRVIVEGKWQRRFRKEYSEGCEMNVVMDDTHVERYTAIICQHCKMRVEIEPDHIVNLFTENIQLRMQVAEQNGQTVRRPETNQRVM